MEQKPDKPVHKQQEAADEASIKVIENRSSKLLRILSFPIAAVVGGYYTDLTTRKRVYMNFKQSTEMFKPGNEIRKKKYHDLINHAKHGKVEDVPLVASEIENVYRATVAEGEFHKIGMKSFKDYFRAMETHQKAETVFFAATVTGVTLGSLLSIANNMGWIRKIFTFKNVSENDPSISK